MAGYIGTRVAVPETRTESKSVINITATTTSLTGLSYTPTQVEVFHNGVRLVDGTDFTATNGTSITLTTAAQNGDQVVVLSSDSLNVANVVPATGGTFSGPVTVDNTNATVLTVDRASTYGTIIDLQKDGTSVGTVGTPFTNELYIEASGVNSSGLLFTSGNTIQPRKNSAADDGNIDIGTGGNRFKSLYLSGGVYLGGTGAANYLDDFEVGTWTPDVVHTSSNNSTWATKQGDYIKIGDMVTCWGRCDAGNSGTSGSALEIKNLPFSISMTSGVQSLGNYAANNLTQRNGNILANGTNIRFYDGGNEITQQTSFASFQFTYKTA